jgi:hypothetical protein
MELIPAKHPESNLEGEGLTNGPTLAAQEHNQGGNMKTTYPSSGTPARLSGLEHNNVQIRPPLLEGVRGNGRSYTGAHDDAITGMG